MSIINLKQLPPPTIIEQIDYEAILERRKEAFIALFPEEEQDNWRRTLALESEPVTKLLEENAYLEMLLRKRINNAALATMLSQSTGNDLDQIGGNFQTLRHSKINDDKSITYENDEDYRLRIQLAFEALSVAGPRDAYRYHALDAHANILDASIYSPAPAYITIAILSRENEGVPTAEELQAVDTAVTAENVRPLADRVTVQPAIMIDYEIEAVIYTYPQPSIEPILQAAQVNLDAYLSESNRIGRDIVRSAIFAALHVEGVQRVELIKPAENRPISPLECARCISQTISYGGTDE